MARLPEDWMTTAWQTIPRLWQVTRQLTPTLHAPGVRAFDEAFLKRHDVAALLWDVDGTLMAYHDRRVAPELEATLADLRDKVPQAILSNCGEVRLEELGTIFPGLPVLKGYRRGRSKLAFRSLRGGEDRWSEGLGEARRAITRPEGPLTALRKPSAALVDFALDELGVARDHRAFMVGDQYFTDIAGANLAGIGSVKVPTLRPDTFPASIRFFQRVERGLFLLLGDRSAERDAARGSA